MKSVRKLYLLSYFYFVSTTISFSFWRMEVYNEVWDLQTNTMTGLSKMSEFSMDTSSCILYDKNIKGGVCIDVSTYNRSEEEGWCIPIYTKLIKFLCCDFIYDKMFLDDQNLKKLNKINQFYEDIYPFGYRKQELVFLLDGSIQYKEKNWLNNFPIYFSCEVKSLSGIIIENTPEKAILKKNEKSIDLTTALRKYFDESLVQNEFFNAIGEYNKKQEDQKFFSTKKVMPILKELEDFSSFPVTPIDLDLLNESTILKELEDFSSFPVTPIDLDLLNESTILAVWCLIPVGAKIEYQMIGLARDIKGNLFHWATNLGQDVSVLMKYAA